MEVWLGRLQRQSQVDLSTGSSGEEVLLLFFSDENKGPWMVSKDLTGCMHEGDIIPKNSVAEAHKIHQQGYRGIVMEYYKRFMQQYELDI